VAQPLLEPNLAEKPVLIGLVWICCSRLPSVRTPAEDRACGPMDSLFGSAQGRLGRPSPHGAHVTVTIRTQTERCGITPSVTA
jgi:hypothetical protein